MGKESKTSLRNYHKLTEKIWHNANALVWFLGNHAFFVILILLLVSILLGGMLLFNHIWALDKESGVVSGPLRFNNDVYRSVLEARKTREESFKAPSEKIYTDPFQ